MSRVRDFRIGLRTIARVLLLSAWLAQAAPSQVPTATRPAEPSRDLKEKWAELFHRHAKDYAITGGGDAAEQARMLPEPVFRWWQPVRGTDAGAIYLWLRAGRPEAVVSIFTIKVGQGERILVHEYHSLASGPVSAEWRGRRAWGFSGPSLEWKPIPGAPPPADSAPARLRQMQALAREFSANTVDRQGSPWQLRMLATPLHRAKDTRPDGTDGALFALVQGTDPEVLLLIETYHEGSGLRWRYALAPFTDLEVHARHKGTEVLSIPLPTQLEGRDGPHGGFSIERRKGDNPGDFDKS